jgi:hypothetical protein
MVTIAIIVVIASIGSISLATMNMNAFARISHHSYRDNDGDSQHVCIVQKHLSVDQKHVCINKKDASSNSQQEEIILSSPDMPQQQFYLNHVNDGNT